MANKFHYTITLVNIICQLQKYQTKDITWSVISRKTVGFSNTRNMKNVQKGAQNQRDKRYKKQEKKGVSLESRDKS